MNGKTVVLLMCLLGLAHGIAMTKKSHQAKKNREEQGELQAGHKAYLGVKIVLQATTGTWLPEIDPTGAMRDQDERTPYVRQMSSGMWEGGVPNYEDIGQPMFTNIFASEGEAKAWVYSKTGAAESVIYQTPPGLDDSLTEQVNKEGTEANNSNYRNKDAEDELEKPIIDKHLAHTAEKTYHDTYDHMSTIKGSGTTSDSKATKAAAAQAAKARSNANMAKSVSARNHLNGGNGQLGAAQHNTQGAKDAASAKSQHLLKVGRR